MPERRRHVECSQGSALDEEGHDERGPRHTLSEEGHVLSRSSGAICCDDLSVGYGGEPVVEGLSFHVEPGSTLAVVGRSGCGKTTLLKTLAGIIEPLDGEAIVSGAELPRSPPAGELGYVPQSLGLVNHATVLRNVLHGKLPGLGAARTLLGRFPRDAERDAREAIERVGLRGEEDSRVKHLSGGQRRRVAVARALVQEPAVLLADEMLSELDPETAESILACISRLQEDMGMTVVIVEHDLGVAEGISDQLIRLEDGGISEHREGGGISSTREDGGISEHREDVGISERLESTGADTADDGGGRG